MADEDRAERIRQLRDERHLTQPAVAEAVDVTLRAYQAWESTGALRWENAKKLADFFEIDAHWLWSGDQSRDGETPDLLRRIGAHGDLADQLTDIVARQKRLEELVRVIVDSWRDDLEPLIGRVEAALDDADRAQADERDAEGSGKAARPARSSPRNDAD